MLRMFQNPSDAALRELLQTSKTIAVVGCSPKPDRTSFQIAAAMQARGYRIIPVNPAGGETILGEKVYAQLEDIPRDIRIDIVDVFRRSEDTLPAAHGAVAIGARCLWLQQGVSNDEAARIAAAAGIMVVMDACLAVYHRLLLR